MEFIKTNIDTANKKEVYRLTKGDSVKVQDLQKGDSLPVDKYAVYNETKVRNRQDGTTEEYTQQVLSFVSGKMKVGTISATFIKSFLEIVDIMGDEPFSIIVSGGKSRNGRDFVNCELDCE